MFSYIFFKKYYNFSFYIRSLIHFKIYFIYICGGTWCKMVLKVLFVCCSSISSLKDYPLITFRGALPLHLCPVLVVHICMDYFGLCTIPLTYLSFVMPVAHSWSHWLYKKSWDQRVSSTLQLCSFSNWFDFSRHFEHFHMNFRTRLAISTKNNKNPQTNPHEIALSL